MKKVFSLFLCLFFVGCACAYYSKGTISVKADKVVVPSGVPISGDNPVVIHEWERCFGVGCDKILKHEENIIYSDE